MFNLIVSGCGWEPHRDSFGSGRVLEYTDAAIVSASCRIKFWISMRWQNCLRCLCPKLRAQETRLRMSEPSRSLNFRAQIFKSNMRLIPPSSIQFVTAADGRELDRRIEFAVHIGQ